jgi:manganese/zinc/iron transport system substrate-binding protein
MKLFYSVIFSIFIGVTNIVHSENNIKIITTTGMIADIIKNITPDNFNVQSIMGTGIDPHLYKPTRSDVEKLINADIIVANGLFLEGKFTNTFIKLSNTGKKVLYAGDFIQKSDLIKPSIESEHPDPHIWMDPVLWANVAKALTLRFSTIYPKLKNQINDESTKYIKKLEKLNLNIINKLNLIDSNSRILVTAHDAFSYFGKRYNLSVKGIQGISTESEAGVKQIDEIISLLVNKKIPAVFIESTVSEKNIRSLLDGSKEQGHQVNIGGTLYSDSMGSSGTKEGTYIGMIMHNVATITKALTKS